MASGFGVLGQPVNCPGNCADRTREVATDWLLRACKARARSSPDVFARAAHNHDEASLGPQGAADAPWHRPRPPRPPPSEHRWPPVCAGGPTKPDLK